MAERAEREQLIERIEEAFADVPRPMSIAQGDRDEPIETREAFSRLHWRDLLNATPEFLFRHQDSNCFMTPEAFRYFLPGLLILGLRDDRPGAADAFQSIFFALSPRHRPDLMDWFLRKISALSEPQRRVIASLFRFLLRHNRRYGWNERDLKAGVEFYSRELPAAVSEEKPQRPKGKAETKAPGRRAGRWWKHRRGRRRVVPDARDEE